MKFLIFIVSVFFLSCGNISEKKTSEKGVSLNNEGMRLYLNNMSSPDSIKKAINLIDSAIVTDSEYLDFYFNKIDLLRVLKEYNAVASVSKQIIKIHPNDFRAYFIIGEMFILEDNKDSSLGYFNKSIQLMNQEKISDIYKDSREVRVHYLVGDSTGFKKKYFEFVRKYATSPDFKSYDLDIKKSLE